MSRRQRFLIFILMLIAALVLGLFFWPVVLNEILAPLALTAWLFLRIFVLSINQNIYWGALILVAFFFLSRHFIQSFMGEEPVSLPEESLKLKDIEFWRNILNIYSMDSEEQFYIKRELVRLMVSMYASKQGVAANFWVMEALRKGEIPLPKTIYTFLFVDETAQTGWSFKLFLKKIWQAPAVWIDERSGRKAAEYYRKIEEVITFLETSLEMKDGK
jgi:hypothetical protein